MPFSGRKLRALREGAGLTRDTLADRAGTTAQYISHLENGVKKNPAFDLVERLGDALSVTCQDFQGDDATEPEATVPTSARPRGRPRKDAGADAAPPATPAAGEATRKPAKKRGKGEGEAGG